MSFTTCKRERPDVRAVKVRGRERGAALVIGLVLLLALAVLGVSAMNMSTLELAMASNRQSHQAAFECAETGIDLSIAQPLAPTGVPALNGSCDDAGDIAFTAQTTFVTTTLPPDGAFSTDIAAFHFDSQSAGSGPRNAASTHTQSFYVLGPSTR